VLFSSFRCATAH